MTITLSMPELTELQPRITVIGVGGAGGNGVNNMIKANLQGVEFVVANTDAQALAHSRADKRIQLGNKLTQGLGAGARPDVGRAAAEENLEEVMQYLTGTHMVFITAGMGGGTGTGAAPVIARAARELGVLTVGVVSKPFQFEGGKRMRLAEEGIAELQKYVDTLIIIPNQNLFRVANEKTTFADAFAMADEVLYSGVRGITDLMVMPGLVNLDFADVRTVMSEMGKAMMGTGEATGDNRALEAAEAAISNPLLDEVSMKGAKGVLINITGGMDLTLYEVDEAANRIRSEVDPEAHILVGSALDDTLNGRMRVSVVATGIDSENSAIVHQVAAQAAAQASARSGRPELVATAPAAARDGFPAAPVAPAAYVDAPMDATNAVDLSANEAYATEAYEDDYAAEENYEETPHADPVLSQPAAAQYADDEADHYDDQAYDDAPQQAYEEQKESRSWFDRLTGRGRRNERSQQQDAYEDDRRAPAPQLRAPRAEMTRMEPARAEPARVEPPRAEPARGEPAQPAAPSLGRNNAEDRPAQRNKLDDQLEIPTFLRRQAN
ncbi:cell division protein FtsZ [Govanella unica]|uniref:Cell division protein FtsZ n=1 Tax=Govanella unica TaxID=2975056 RepID=A0A9X3U283_9PROT|nr:cell division protein FtsZ [Govania unica]MDA5195084.1 cell division protein FtsZ [Govania unica]